MTLDELERFAKDNAERVGTMDVLPSTISALFTRLRATEALVEAVGSAINNAGPNPQHHREVMARHRREWPTLWRALDALRGEG